MQWDWREGEGGSAPSSCAYQCRTDTVPMVPADR